MKFKIDHVYTDIISVSYLKSKIWNSIPQEKKRYNFGNIQNQDHIYIYIVIRYALSLKCLILSINNRAIYTRIVKK